MIKELKFHLQIIGGVILMLIGVGILCSVDWKVLGKAMMHVATDDYPYQRGDIIEHVLGAKGIVTDFSIHDCRPVYCVTMQNGLRARWNEIEVKGKAE